MIRLPTSVEEALADVAEGGEWRSGGTDVTERRKSGRTKGDVVDLRDVPGLDRIDDAEGGIRVGAKVRIAALAADPRTPRGLAAAAGGLATPQIRAVATVGGNLRQHVRCWYYRNPQFTCWRAGGAECLSRSGDHLYHVAFDTGPCAAPHPSTLACALLAYDAVVETSDGDVAIADFLAKTAELPDGVPHGPLVRAVRVRSPGKPEGAAYFRSIARARAEWPLVECVARVAVADGVVQSAVIAIGGVAPTPLRREAVEQALIGQSPTPVILAAAAARAADGAKPLPMTAYKVDLLGPTVLETLERAVAAAE